MSFLSLAAIASALAFVSAAPAGLDNVISQYPLVDTYDASNWLSKFNVQNIRDPTGGFVNYLSQSDAQNFNILRAPYNGQVYMGVDSTTVLSPSGAGRNSVRVTSKTSYTHGLFIADIAHMPSSTCGLWPAFWMVGNNWPGDGEIDIIENVNEAQTNQLTLHTSPGCTPAISPGTLVGPADCGAAGGSLGCGTVGAPYGDSFNALGGGVYAMQWTSSGITVWFFARGNIPGDITAGVPNPAGWGGPVASFSQGCDFDGHFRGLSLVFDTTFCGQWAGAVWGSSSCASRAPTCEAFVAGNPSAFNDAFWLVNSVKVYGV